MTQTKFRKRILIADDDLDDRIIMQHALMQHFILDEVVFTEDGSMLLEHLQKQKPHMLPDLILLDINMPKMSGMEALEIIKSTVGFRHIPVIMFTTSSSSEEMRKAYELGSAGFILKPNTLQDFTAILKTIGEYWFNLVKLPH